VNKQHLQSKIFSRKEDLGSQVREWQSKQEMVVFTNGCFDILHVGHVLYLEEAKNEGHKLVVAVNSDDSVKKLKGPGRPINNEKSRLTVLAALESVDAVILFHEDTPYEMIQSLRPDVLVKGGDYPVESIVGNELVTGYGGRVKTLSLIDGFSTTNIEQKLKNSC
jgi:rfaE bifunctional protein nucleotidyltransferase chain/domain